MGDDYAVRLFHYHVTAARNCYKDEKKTFSVRGNIKKKVKECRALCQSQSSTSVETNSSQLDGTSDCDFENAWRDKAKTPC